MSRKSKPTRPRPRPATTTTALARRPQTQTIVIRDPEQRLPPPVAALVTLGEQEMLGSFGTVDVKLTKAEEAVCAEPVPRAEVRLKPTGTPYLSHPSYTRWLNRAFGRLGWALRQVGLPKVQGSSVLVPYVLTVHGQPVAAAWGEQDYHENNPEQTYGDAVESTVANALRRCAKRIGIGLELWDREWVDDYIDRDCVRVKVQARDKVKYQWRRKVDRPFWNELSGRAAAEAKDVDESQRRPSASSAPPKRDPPPPPGVRATDHLPITEGQVKRLHTIASNAGRKGPDVKKWLLDRYGVTSSTLLTRGVYDDVCNWLESSSTLPSAPYRPAREPGEEG